MMTQPPTEQPADRGLLRALGRWDLLALVINGIVGAGIFGLPAKVQSLLGVYGIWAILVCAAIMALVILCFAEVASRFAQTGGPFVYASVAFGPFIGFLTGWVLWVARVTGACAICNLLLQYLAYVDPGWNQGIGRIVTASAIIGMLTVSPRRCCCSDLPSSAGKVWWSRRGRLVIRNVIYRERSSGGSALLQFFIY